MSPRLKYRRSDVVDYSSRHNERRRLGKYLRAGNFRDAAGRLHYKHNVRRNRLILLLAAAAVCATGGYFVFF